MFTEQYPQEPRENNPNAHQLTMDKQKTVYPYNGILHSSKKKRKKKRNNICYNIDEPRKHYAKKKKPGIR